MGKAAVKARQAKRAAQWDQKRADSQLHNVKKKAFEIWAGTLWEKKRILEVARKQAKPDVVYYSDDEGGDWTAEEWKEWYNSQAEYAEYSGGADWAWEDCGWGSDDRPEIRSALEILSLLQFADENMRALSVPAIERAYRRRALEQHPDKGGCGEKFMEAKLARETLLAAIAGRSDKFGPGDDGVLELEFGGSRVEMIFGRRNTLPEGDIWAAV